MEEGETSSRKDGITSGRRWCKKQWAFKKDLRKKTEAWEWKEGNVHILNRPDGCCVSLSFFSHWLLLCPSEAGVRWWSSRAGDSKGHLIFLSLLAFSFLPSLKWFLLTIHGQLLSLLGREILQFGIKIWNYCQRQADFTLKVHPHHSS